MNRTPRWVVCLLAVLVSAAAFAQPKYPERWNYVKTSLATDEGLTRFLDILQQSKAVGCTHILMPEGRWLRAPEDRAYLARVEKVKAAAKELNLTIVPVVYAIGYSGRYLGFDPNLGAGLPVKDMVFLVKGDKAAPDPAEALDVSKVAPDGATLKCKPFTFYRVTLYTKTEPTRGGDGVRATGTTSKRWLTRSNAYVKKDGDRWQIMNTFNSLEDSEIRLQISVKDWSDLKIEPAGALLIVRRDLTPLKVTSEDGSVTYEEGKDFKKLVDPVIGKGSGEFASDHDANPIELTADSRIKDGQKLKVSFFHTYRLGSDQNCISTEDPKVFQIMEQDVANCVKVWQPAGIFMNYDEIRMGGWETPDKKPGQILAEHTKKGYGLVRKYAPDAKVYTWSDMYSPLHNARPFGPRGYYYLAHGNWDGAWEGLPNDVIIMNWYGPSPEAIKWFADRGHQQVICGYYDKRDTAGLKENITNWLKNSQGVPNIRGFMYTTWRSNYGHLKEYFQLLDTYDQWAGQTTTKPEAEPGVPTP